VRAGFCLTTTQSNLMTLSDGNLLFPKFHPGRIGAMRQNQRIIDARIPSQLFGTLSLAATHIESRIVHRSNFSSSVEPRN
jgi:hypothetical protein